MSAEPSPPLPVSAPEPPSARHVGLKVALLALWAASSFGACFFARDLQFLWAGWPLNYWVAAQGAVLAFIGIVVAYAWVMNRHERLLAREASPDA